MARLYIAADRMVKTLHSAAGVPAEKPSLPPESERRAADRRATDANLVRERHTTDGILDERGEERVIDIVRDRRSDAERRLKSVRQRNDGELEQSTDALPEVSDRLEQVADRLNKAAESLSGVAETLHDSLPERKPIDIVDDMAQVAEDVADTAERIGDSPAPVLSAERDASGQLAEQLADIAEGMAEVTATLADERRDEDDRLKQERQVTDRVVAQEMAGIGAGLLDQLRHERSRLRVERAATDATLSVERRNTDEAVEHVLDLLADGVDARRKAEQTVATRTELLRIVSHDLRGPLMAIGGVASLMAEHAHGEREDERLASWAAMIKRSVSVMDRLVHDLLDFGSFENGRLRVIAAPHDVRDVVGNAVEAFARAAEVKQLSLSAERPPEPVAAVFDQHRVFQVLSNLLHNAIKFTPRGGSIRVTIRSLDNECVVSVIDTGIGIPKHELTSIFEQFHQLDAGDRRGLGLGLYISLWIVEAHGGRIWADSEAGAGATVSFTLPLHQPTA